VTKIVASSATISDIKVRLIMINHSFFVGAHVSVTRAGSSPVASTSIDVMVGSLGFREEAGRELGAVVSGLFVFSLSTTEYVSDA
jgi:hypothetical protein